MTIHLYLSLIPEALIASMLPPEEFGTYYAVGSSKKQRGQAMFIELDADFRHEFFRIDEGYARCMPHDDGAIKKSVYISTYRVLEHVPPSAYKKLYLVTSYGEALGLDPAPSIPSRREGLYMFQEIAPVRPLVVSRLNPEAFYNFITQETDSLVHLPAIAFVDLRLGKLTTDPEHGALEDLPYKNVHHLRECLIELKTKEVDTKMVNRVESVEFPYRTIQSGIYVGNRDGLAYFPLPPRDELRSKYYRWWRSANA